MAKNNKTRFFYDLYSDKTWVFDQSERAYYPIYIINIYKVKKVAMVQGQKGIYIFSKIQLVVYHQCCVLIG